MSTNTWQSDWPFRVYQRIGELGFHSLSEYFASRPMVPLLDLADELGFDIAAVQLELLWFREAEARGQLAHALGSLLIRSIRDELPDGWSRGEDFDFRLVGAFASWGQMACCVLSESQRDQVWDCLRSLSPGPGWLPVVPPDAATSRLLEAIEEALARAGDPEAPPS